MRLIFDTLETAELNPYFLGQHRGLCEKPFIVIKRGSTLPSLNSNKVGQSIIDIIAFVPENDYLIVEPYKTAIKVALKELDVLRKTGNETPEITDDDKKALTFSIEYIIQKKMEG